MNRPKKKKKVKIDPAYVAQIEALNAKGQAWINEHPDKSPSVQFNWPKTVFLIASMEDAFDKHMITANAEGRLLLAAMCDGLPEAKMPTVTMVRFAFEHLHPPRAFRVPSSPCPSCGTVCDASGVLADQGRPNPRDFTVCAVCGELSQYDEKMHLRAPDPADLAEANSDPCTAAILKVAIETAKELARKRREAGQ